MAFCLQLYVEAYDTANPDNRARAEVIIDVRRNPNYPTFRPGVFRARIQDNHLPGREVINVTASDLDGVRRPD